MIKKYIINNYCKGIFKKFENITFEKKENKTHIMNINFEGLTGAEKNVINKYIENMGLEKRELK